MRKYFRHLLVPLIALAARLLTFAFYHVRIVRVTRRSIIAIHCDWYI
jgi:hypothetical protein